MSDLQKEWRVVPCQCVDENCRKVHIEPVITCIEASISRKLGEHIVELHNKWLMTQRPIAKSIDISTGQTVDHYRKEPES